MTSESRGHPESSSRPLSPLKDGGEFTFEAPEVAIQVDSDLTETFSKPIPKREKSFRNFFKRKSEVPGTPERTMTSGTFGGSSSLHVPISSPTFSSHSDNVSAHSLRSDEESGSTSVGDKLSTKWKIHRHNLDKNDQADVRQLQLSSYLAEHYYDAFNYNWEEMADMYMFGGKLTSIFNATGKLGQEQFESSLMTWLLLGGDEKGGLGFSLDHEYVENQEFYAQEDTRSLETLLEYFVPLVQALDVFKRAVSYFKENTDNYDQLKQRDSNVEILESVADKKGLPIPLSQVLLGNWLIQFASHSEAPDFSDEKILSLFRRGARNSLVLKYLYAKGYFTEFMEHLSAQGQDRAANQLTFAEMHSFLTAYFVKDNQTSIGLSIYGIANSYHVKKSFNKAITMFEIGAHISHDLDCCSMAAMGLSNGYGYGKKHGKDNKFHRKQRIAKIYRIMKDNGGVLDVGTSWAFKEKYG